MFKILTSTITAGCLALASQTALALPNISAATPIADATSSESVRVLKSGSLVDEAGREISYELWIDGGVIYGDARVEDTRGNVLELWRDGDVIFYEGMLGGEPVVGDIPADIDANTEQAFCPGLLILLCIGAIFLGGGSSGCAHSKGTGCDGGPTHVPGDQGQGDGGGGAPGDGPDEEEPPPGGGGDAE